VKALQSKSFLSKETVVEIETALSERDTLPAHPSPSAAPKVSETTPSRQGKPNSSVVQNGRLDKKQIEQRIEEDRERHKRLRESIWAVSSTIEAKKTYQEASDFEEDDEIVGVEDKADKAQFISVKT
jgi:CTD kinase subunit gamma